MQYYTHYVCVVQLFIVLLYYEDKKNVKRAAINQALQCLSNTGSFFVLIRLHFWIQLKQGESKTNQLGENRTIHQLIC